MKKRFDKTQRRQKNISTLNGLIIIFAEIIILFGGVFTWQYFALKQVGLAVISPSLSAQQILNKPFPLAGEPADQTDSEKFTFPTGGENFITGNNQKITWQMPNGDTYYDITIDLINEQGDRIGSIIDWNWVKYNPIDSTNWDFKTIYNPVSIKCNTTDVLKCQPLDMLKIDKNVKIQTGNYKLRLTYNYANPDATKEPSGPQGSFDSNYFKIID